VVGVGVRGSGVGGAVVGGAVVGAIVGVDVGVGVGVGASLGAAVAVAVGVLVASVGEGVGDALPDAPHDAVSATRTTPIRRLAAVAMTVQDGALLRLNQGFPGQCRPIPPGSMDCPKDPSGRRGR
jgi:hypothetical protein